MIAPEELRARARELRIAAEETTFVDLYEEHNELATLIARRGRRNLAISSAHCSSSVGQDILE